MLLHLWLVLHLWLIFIKFMVVVTFMVFITFMGDTHRDKVPQGNLKPDLTGVGRARIPSRKCILLEMSEKFAENASILNRFWLRLQAPDTTQFKLSLRDIRYFHNSVTGYSINKEVLKRRLIQLLVGQPLQLLSTGSKGFLDCEQCFRARALSEHH